MTAPADPYYSDEFVTLYHGDCREIMAELDWDAAITDPPYAVRFRGKATKWTDADGGYDDTDDGPALLTETVLPIVRALVEAGRPTAITPGVKSLFSYPEPVNVGAIYYPSGAGACSWGFTCSQPILYYGKDPFLSRGLGSRPNSFASTEAAEVNGHPCPKPIGTMRWLVARASWPGDVVLDPFAGSGTTLVAAKEANRKAIGIELTERYCEIAAKRLAQGVLDFGASA